MQGRSSCRFAWISPVLLTEKRADNSTIIGSFLALSRGRGLACVLNLYRSHSDMKKRLILTLIGLVILIVILVAVKALQIRAMIDQGKKFVPPPETVTSTIVKAESWETALTAVGTLNAVQGVTIAAELAGKVVEIAFEAGTPVKKGDILLRQDTSSEEAQLPGVVAQVKLASTNLERMNQLFSKQLISTGRPRYRRRKRGAGAVPGRHHTGHHRQEDDPRPLQRPTRHPPGQPWPDAPRGGSHRHPAGP